MNDKEVFHTCKVLGKKFTFREYYDYIDNHDSGQPVFSQDGFDWNFFYVCLDPRVYVLKDSSSFSAEVKVAKYEDKYYYGYYCHSFDEGNISPCRITLGMDFDTEDDAVRHAFYTIKKYWGKKAEGMKLPVRQLELF